MKITKNELPNAPTSEINKSILGIAAARATEAKNKKFYVSTFFVGTLI